MMLGDERRRQSSNGTGFPATTSSSTALQVSKGGHASGIGHLATFSATALQTNGNLLVLEIYFPVFKGIYY